MLQYMNDTLKPLSELDTQIHDTLKKTVDELDKRLKEKATEDLYLVEFYEWDDWSCRSFEVYSDRKEAEKRFFEIVKYWFADDIKNSGMNPDMDWTKVWDLKCWSFEFTTDMYSNYYANRVANKQYWENPMYPKNTWRACNPDYYNEVTLTKLKINKKAIKSEDEKKD